MTDTFVAVTEIIGYSLEIAARSLAMTSRNEVFAKNRITNYALNWVCAFALTFAVANISLIGR